MNLYYYRDPLGNLGDDLNEWMWEKLLPGCLDPADEIQFSAVGTMIDHRMPPARNWIVFSSGAGYKAPPQDFGGAGWHIVSVRGPLTAKVLNLPPETAVTDGAILIHLFPECAPLPPEQREGVVFMPHHKPGRIGHWKEACDLAGIHCIDHTADLKDNLKRIRGAKLMIADAMHGAILADTFRVPWIPAMTSREINSFKWIDWTESMEVPYQPTDLCASSAQEALRRLRFRLNAGFSLADPTVEAAVADYHRRFGGPSQIRILVRKSFTALYYALRGMLGSKPFSGLRKRWDRKAEEKAAARLMAVSEMPAFLSDDTVFQNRVDQMRSRLEEVKKLARELKEPE